MASVSVETPCKWHHKWRFRVSAVDSRNQRGPNFQNRGVSASCRVLLSLGQNLLLELIWLGESESDLVGGQLVVAVHDGINLAIHGILVQWIKLNLLVLLSVKGNSDRLGSDVGREHLEG